MKNSKGLKTKGKELLARSAETAKVAMPVLSSGHAVRLFHVTVARNRNELCCLNCLAYALLIALCTLLFTLCHAAVEAKVYIDISSPAYIKLPIAVQELRGPLGKEISDIIRDDLEFTGLFFIIDRNAYIENPSQPFNPKNWSPLGAEAVVKGLIKQEKELTAMVSLYDVLEGTEILRKEYRTERNLIRPLAHTITNDIYHILTGEKGIFRSRIAFVAENRDKKDIYIIDWDGERMSGTGLKKNIISSLRWSRDGTKLIYSVERNRQWAIYLLDFLHRTERKIFSSKGTHIVGDFLPRGDNFMLSSSKDGSLNLYIMSLKNKNSKRLTYSHNIDVSPTVSPDGNHIAFVSDRGGSPQIYTMQREGSDVKRITFEGPYNTSPSWSPKGDKIVFSGMRGKNQIFIVNPDGTELNQLTTRGNNEDPSFSPDGRYITFTSDRDGVKGIYIMRANGEYQKKITPKNIRASSPRWSPNF